MKEYIFSYTPLVFEGEGGDENRITREQFANKIRLSGAISFINKAVITPFETALEQSGLEKICCGSFDVCVALKAGKKSKSWKNVYEQLNTFLEIRADDSRADGQQDVKAIPGIGYCIGVSALMMHIGKLVEEETKVPQPSRKIEWPERADFPYPTELVIPAINYREPNQESACAVWQARELTGGAVENVIKPFSQELQRWFYAQTGYRKPDKLPSKEKGFVERTLAIEPGSYIQIQLIPEETPKYQDIIKLVTSELRAIAEDKPSHVFRNTKQPDGQYVNIKSVYNFLERDNLAKEGLIKADARYDIVP